MNLSDGIALVRCLAVPGGGLLVVLNQLAGIARASAAGCVSLTDQNLRSCIAAGRLGKQRRIDCHSRWSWRLRDRRHHCHGKEHKEDKKLSWGVSNEESHNEASIVALDFDGTSLLSQRRIRIFSRAASATQVPAQILWMVAVGECGFTGYAPGTNQL